jgi:hypothetical protein
MTGRAWTVFATVALAAAASAVVPPAALAATCGTDVSVDGDVDGDGTSDLVVGLPGWAGSTGAVDLRVSSAPSSVLTRAAAGLGSGQAGDRFGAAVALADLDDDGCDELLVGAPGAGGTGRLYVVPGAPNGFAATGARTLSGASVGDGFGTAVAIARNRAGTGFDLWVGAPTDDVATAADAGSVSHFSVTSAAGDFTITPVETVTQDTAGVPGAPEAGDRFGAVLSASRYGGFVGQPSEDVGSAVDAGILTVLRTTDLDAPFDGATAWSQASAGVAGSPEAYDRFGGAVSAMEQHAIVGVAGEDLGASADAGLVQVFRPLTPAELGPGKAYSQDSPGIPGGVEAGDRFGAAVLLFQDRCFDESVDAAVGAPGEDITVTGSSRVDAGTVATFTVTDWPDDCAPAGVNQDTVLSGAPESGDRLGSALGVGRHREPGDGDINDRVFIGTPGEDIGSSTDAGLVQATSVGTPTNPTEFLVAGDWRPAAGFSGGDTARLGYGAVLAAPAG